MIRRFLAIATIAAPIACAGLLELDPGTARVGADGGPDSEADTATGETETGTGGEAGPRGCASALAKGFYCDDFDEPGRTDPSARDAKASEDAGNLSLVTTFAKSSPRSLQAKYLPFPAFPRGYLTTPSRKVTGEFHLTMQVRIAREGISQGEAFMIGELQEVPGRDGTTYTIHLTPRQEHVELRLKQGPVVLVWHQNNIPYDEWHLVTMRFNARQAYLALDGDAVNAAGGVNDLDSDFYVHFGLEAFSPATVYLDDVEIGP
jgi:hypothetical protein